MKKLLMGNEAIALGAIRAGVRVVSGYPGTPSTEILETIAKEVSAARKGALEEGSSPAEKLSRIYIEWSVNEKAALELAAGAAMSGARSLVTMKQVGLNVASDPLMSLNYVGVKGGLVVAVADDPGPISSQTEQDTRRFGKFAKLMVFDPASPAEAYTMIADAFDWSEKYGRPVIFRPTTRVCHSYASVEILPDLPQKDIGVFEKSQRWVIFPGLAYRSHIQIEKDLIQLGDEFSAYSGNKLSVISGASPNAIHPPCAVSPRRGIAAGGVSRAYTHEVLAKLDTQPKPKAEFSPPDSNTAYKLLEVSTVPFPSKLGKEFLAGLDEVLVIEELDPVIEDELIRLCGLHHLNVKIRGKLSGDMPNAGENTVALIAEKINNFFGIPSSVTNSPTEASAEAPGRSSAPDIPALPVRPPVLCAGCPHRGSFFAVKEAVRKSGAGKNGQQGFPRKAVFSGDIGCYTLGNAMPLDMTDTCLCMGAGITVAQGINRAEPDTLNFAFIGDSTFFHTGIPGIVNAVYNQAKIIVVILDNYTTAMTGSQPHPGTGKSVLGSPAEKISIYDVVKALGVKDIVRANPFDIKVAEDAVTQMLDKKGVRVILFEGPCIAVEAGSGKCSITAAQCTGCRICVKKLGCPAISLVPTETASGSGLSEPVAGASDAGRPKLRALIDPVLCTGCGICKPVCPAGAIQ
ncbi:indolepyruvate ferredoxin oxidoreductase subunit alpha [Spirochaetia bacterium]|nr:indolepyruvate ferredoxin oxidoreductase subunit alpha [Spirochaetia bacterium]